MKYLKVLLIFLIPFLISCTQVTIYPIPTPPVIIRIAVTPTLAPILQGRLYNCAGKIQGMDIVMDITPKIHLNHDNSDLIIQIGAIPQEIGGYKYQIGTEEILLVSNLELKYSELKRDTIKDFFTSNQTPLMVFTYPKDHELRLIFDHLVQIDKTTPYAVEVPNPAAVLESIEAEKNAIGFIPRSWYSGDFPIITMDGINPNETIFPILVVINHEPEIKEKELIQCLQTNNQFSNH